MVAKPAFNLDPIRQALAVRGSAFNDLAYFPSIPSTNAWLMTQGHVHGRVAVADCQTAGRGQRGRTWVGGTAQNLQFSLGWKMYGLLDTAIALAVGVGVIRALRSLGVEGLGLKWPNDIMLNRIKLGGILLESRLGRQAITGLEGLSIPYEYVIGIGLNFSLGKAELDKIDQQAIDLASVGSSISREGVLQALLVEIESVLSVFQQQGFEAFRQEWQDEHIYQGEIVSFDNKACLVQGRVIGVNLQGALGIEFAGERQYFHSGEISLPKPIVKLHAEASDKSLL